MQLAFKMSYDGSCSASSVPTLAAFTKTPEVREWLRGEPRRVKGADDLFGDDCDRAIYALGLRGRVHSRVIDSLERFYLSDSDELLADLFTESQLRQFEVEVCEVLLAAVIGGLSG